MDASFSQLLSGLLSPDNQTRSHAEQAIETAKQNPDALANGLIAALRHSELTELRSLSAVLIRRVRIMTCTRRVP